MRRSPWVWFALLALASPAWAVVQVYPAGSTVAGKTLPEWTAKWWQWQYAIPAADNPWYDFTGAKTALGNQGNVFFLTGAVGIMGDPLNVVATRTATIPAYKPVFVPLLNASVDNPTFNSPGVPAPDPPKTVAELRAVGEWAATPVAAGGGLLNVFATIDGSPVADVMSHREISPVFSYVIPENSVYSAAGHANYGYPGGMVFDPVVSDGYWLMLEGLPLGQHTIHFGGEYDMNGDGVDSPGDFKLDITYVVTAVPEPAAVWVALAGMALGSLRRWR